MITRDIYRDFYRSPTGPTVEDKIFLVARRACYGVAGIAVVLGLLDIAGIHSLGNVSQFASNSRERALAFGEAVRGGINEISVWRDPAVARVKIPTVQVQVERPAPAPVVNKIIAATPAGEKPAPVLLSSVEKLAATGRQDVFAMAMTQPKSVFAPPLREAPQLVTYSSPLAPTVSAPPALDAAPEPSISAPVAALPLSLVPLPRPAPGAPPPSPAERLGLTKPGQEKEYARAQRCLANAIYFEARSEPVRGQMAVAQVIMNRAFSGFYPGDVCSVVYQNAHRRLACQFTFACDGKSKAINERGHWARANRIARETLEGQIFLPEVARSTHYHASYVHPNWVREMRRLAHYGLHSFYRPIAWGNGADEPQWGAAALARAEAKHEGKTKTR